MPREKLIDQHIYWLKNEIHTFATSKLRMKLVYCLFKLILLVICIIYSVYESLNMHDIFKYH